MFQYKLLQDAIWTQRKMQQIWSIQMSDSSIEKAQSQRKGNGTQEDATCYVASGKLSPRYHKLTPVTEINVNV